MRRSPRTAVCGTCRCCRIQISGYGAASKQDDVGGSGQVHHECSSDSCRLPANCNGFTVGRFCASIHRNTDQRQYCAWAQQDSGLHVVLHIFLQTSDCAERPRSPVCPIHHGLYTGLQSRLKGSTVSRGVSVFTRAAWRKERDEEEEEDGWHAGAESSQELNITPTIAWTKR